MFSRTEIVRKGWGRTVADVREQNRRVWLSLQQAFGSYLAAKIVAMINGRNAQILLKNSNFCVDHNSEERWQPRWKIP
jgi:hypothetical protein